MRVDCYASEVHYSRHIAPIWLALPPDNRGLFWWGSDRRTWSELRWWGIDASSLQSGAPDGSPILIAASWQDARKGRGTVALVEHGTGQTYEGWDSPSYSGGSERGFIDLFLCPNEFVAERNRRRYPEARVEVVGCPAMDRWQRGASEHPVACVSFHWDCDSGPPEASWAFPHYRDCLKAVREELEAQGITLIGHGHPRVFQSLRSHYEACGIEAVERFEDVIQRASVYACDNSSTLWEFASLDRPIVLMDAPWFRPDVEHGLRFWEWADAGLRVQHPAELDGVIAESFHDDPRASIRRQAVATLYGFTDGTSSKRAADAVLSLEAGRPKMTNPYAPRVKLTQTFAEAFEPAFQTVPEGTAASVLEWVGDDPVRARAALAFESQRPKPRKTLIVDLGKIAGA